jgi:hypothetical protein
MASRRDLEAAETEPLVSRERKRKLWRDVLAKVQREVVGGEPGDPNFAVALQMGIRAAAFSVLLGMIAWKKTYVEHLGLDVYAEHMPLAICILVFSIRPAFGTVMQNAGAAITGVFLACLNAFILRGIWPRGVEPGMGTFALEKVVGWANVMLFDFVLLFSNVHSGCRIFAIAQNKIFLLDFLNPESSAVFRHHLATPFDGVAFRSFVGVSMGGVLAVVVMLLPYAWCFAYNGMKVNAQKASADICKMFMNSVEYCSCRYHTVAIEKQLHQLELLRREIDGFDVSIDASYFETFDIGTPGIVRGLMKKHSELLHELYDILHAMVMALEMAEFDSSHVKVMSEISETSTDLVQASTVLLVSATNASHARISIDEKVKLATMEDAVKRAMRRLSAEFDQSRRNFAKPLLRELLCVSSFVFTLSAFGREVREYSKTLRNDVPEGATWVGALSTPTLPSVGGVRFVPRYLAGLMLCFGYSAIMDGFSPACAVTAVLLLAQRGGAVHDVQRALDVAFSVIVGSVAGAVLFSWSCASSHGEVVLPIVFFLYMVPCIHLATGESRGESSRASFTNMGFFAAALAPFAMVQTCPAVAAAGHEESFGSATSPWSGVRAHSLAMLILVLCEFMFMEKRHSTFATDLYNDALQSIQTAFAELWNDNDPKPALEHIPKTLGNVAVFAEGAKLEPRFGACEWNTVFMHDCCDAVASLRIDVLLIHRCMRGGNGRTDKMFKTLRLAPGFEFMKEELANLLESARVTSTSLLLHREGVFDAFRDFDGWSEERIDRMEGVDKAIDDLVTGGLLFPANAPKTMESDRLCQISLLITMLEFAKQHMASIIRSGIRNA